MRPVQAFILLVVIYFGAAQETTNHDSNTIEPSPSVRLDPYIRKALLKALSDLEESDNLTTETTDGTSPTGGESTGDGIAVAQANKENIQIHSFVVNGQSAFDNNSNTAPMLIDNNISILSTTVGNVENHVTATLPTQATFGEIFQARETGVNVQQIRSIPSTSKSGSGNLAHSKLTTSKPRISTTTTTTTTSTTTPKPTHNEDGENIEEVNKKDVQVFQAPLVAAFTVQQDAHGVPKKVIPIYQQTNIFDGSKTPSNTNPPTNILLPQLLTSNIQANHFQNVPSTEFINQQLALQKQLEEKQRLLEEQLRFLQIQQRQQEELLRNQQLLLQQKEAARLQQTLFEQEQFKKQQLLREQQKLPNQQILNNFQTHNNFPQTQIFSQNNLKPFKSQVSIQPSISFDQTNTLNAQQQLPNKEAVDFLIHLRTKQQNQFPLQENHLPQGIGNFLQPNSVQNFNQAQSTRVFRNENGVGNFGLNIPNYSRFNTFEPPFTNRFSTPNRFNHFNSDVELKQLLAQSSLNSRDQEELNIVSKVLSLNHGVPFNSIPNRLSFDNRRRTRNSP